MSNLIHATALVESGAVLGDNVMVGPGAYIESGAHIGDECHIGPRAIVCRHAILGNGCRLHTGAVVADDPQDLKFTGVTSFVRVGARVVLREYVTIHRGTTEGSETVIGDDCYLMACSHVGHNARVGKGVILVNGALLAGHVEIGDGAIISGNAGVHQYVRVGRLAIMGGLSVATKDIPPFCMQGSGVRNTLTGLNVVGLRRAGMSAEDRLAIKRVYQNLFKSGLNVRQAVRLIRAEEMNPYALEMVEFIERSQRGVATARCEYTEEE